MVDRVHVRVCAYMCVCAYVCVCVYESAAHTKRVGRRRAGFARQDGTGAIERQLNVVAIEGYARLSEDGRRHIS